jgi:hypothetical protein
VGTMLVWSPFAPRGCPARAFSFVPYVNNQKCTKVLKRHHTQPHLCKASRFFNLAWLGTLIAAVSSLM